ncbi:MAG TPA: hypothetical protein VFK22_01810 [Candidatus Dormibacteraeota bacterium]|nr:hypothetical protein [Candidatus Dormibacteraeota bacterium]
MRVLTAAFAALLLGAGCSHIPGMGHASSSATASASATPTGANGSPLAKASGTLDAEVAMPAGFPTDVPVYPKARLTAGASFTSPGQVTWGMEWETTDDPNKVKAFYAKQLTLGDWALTVNGAGSGPLFAGTFARKSNSHETGTIAVNADQGVTMIDLSFLSGA